MRIATNSASLMACGRQRRTITDSSIARVTFITIGESGIHKAAIFLGRQRYTLVQRMQRPKRVVNARSAVRTVIYPVHAVEERTPEMAKNEIMEPLPVRKRLPGERLLKQMAKQRSKQKEKAMAEREAKREAEAAEAAVAEAPLPIDNFISPEQVDIALSRIMKDLGV